MNTFVDIVCVCGGESPLNWIILGVISVVKLLFRVFL